VAYQDGSIGVTDDALTITGLLLPRHRQARSAGRRTVGPPDRHGRTSWQRPHLGTANPGYWANFDPRRRRKTIAFLVDAGKAVKPFLTADDPAAFEAALRERGVEITDSGSAPVVSPHISNHPRRLWAPLLPGRPRPGRPPRRQSRTPSR
jgi:hypothetical protein